MLTSLNSTWDWVLGNWIWQSKIREEFVVGELKQSHVEFDESSHYFVVNIEGKTLVEFIWLDPSDLLTHYLDSVVDTLDREEGLSEALWKGAIEHEVFIECLACFKVFLLHFESEMLWELSKEWD